MNFGMNGKSLKTRPPGRRGRGTTGGLRRGGALTDPGAHAPQDRRRPRPGHTPGRAVLQSPRPPPVPAREPRRAGTEDSHRHPSPDSADVARRRLRGGHLGDGQRQDVGLCPPDAASAQDARKRRGPSNASRAPPGPRAGSRPRAGGASESRLQGTYARHAASRPHGPRGDPEADRAAERERRVRDLGRDARASHAAPERERAAPKRRPHRGVRRGGPDGGRRVLAGGPAHPPRLPPRRTDRDVLGDAPAVAGRGGA